MVKVVLGIKKCHQVTSSRFLTIGMSRNTSMGEELYDNRVSIIFYSYVVRQSKFYDFPSYEFPCVFQEMNTRRMAARRLEEERVNQDVPPKVEQVPQGGQGVQGSKVPPQGDNIPNVEGVNEVPVVHLKFTSQEIREALMA